MRRMVFDAMRIAPWVREKAGRSVTELETEIAVELDGELAADVIYDEFTGSNICMHCRFDSPTAPNRLFYWMAFDYPFNQLRVERCTAIVRSGNARSLHLQDRLGFRHEATLAGYYPGENAEIFVMRRDDCRFLGWRNAI